ncbi:MAG: hypothetical protein KAR11_01965 [Phycisphaerae bacterium]|nr:hypothetical protein [Phycisphaerae bacterium]
MADLKQLKRVAKKVAKTFRKPSFLAGVTKIITQSPCIPPDPGIYGWYFKEVPHGVPTRGCVKAGGMFSKKVLIYVGISNNLDRRIRQFHCGNSESVSTLRKKLKLLLDFDEKQLSDWMAKNAFVCWVVKGGGIVPHDFSQGDIGDIEKLIIQKHLNLPLNAEHNTSHPFHERMKMLTRRN